MIDQQPFFDLLPNEIKPAFQELNVLKHLRKAGFKKKFGFTCTYLFRLVFVLLFHQKNWFRLLESKKGETFPGKDAVYRFLNHSGYAWRRFLLTLSGETILRMEPLTSATRETVFIFDDSMFERNRSKAVEMLARFKDHATGAFSEIIDKCSHGYKRRQEAFCSAPHVIAAMLDRASHPNRTCVRYSRHHRVRPAPFQEERMVGASFNRPDLNGSRHHSNLTDALGHRGFLQVRQILVTPAKRISRPFV